MLNEGSDKAHDYLAKLFYPDDQIDEVSWEDIVLEVGTLFREANEIVNELQKMKKSNREFEDQIENLLEERDGQKNVIEECQETAETQQQAAMELFRDLGFDTSQLMTNETLDFTNPNVLYNLQKQMERFKK